jgi:prepilin-type N-terminal cleavage/methylation domain-containing protein
MVSLAKRGRAPRGTAWPHIVRPPRSPSACPSMAARPSRRAGFSFVELLVSIVIAGIAFAALTPLFVSAQQRAAGDQMRNIALNIAQDKIEKVRALSYAQIVAASGTPASTPNLYNSSFMGGQFGPVATSTSASGATKTFAVAYKVSEVGSGTSAYKKVTVDVSWTPPPSPVKHVVLTTMVTKQYAGPQITNLALTPTNMSGDVTGKPVSMTATIAPADVSSMAANGSLKGKVVFYVFSAINGTQVASYTVNTGDAGNSSPGTYTASWDAATAADGAYSFRAQAYDNASSTSPDPGNVWQRNANVTLSGAPPKVTGLTATPGDTRAVLSWTASSASDFDHYEVWVGTAAGAETQLSLSPALTANSYIKTGLTNDDTYYFRVYAVDADGNKSPASDEVFVMPTNAAYAAAPTAPGSFGVTASFNTIVLGWTVSSQDATSTLAGYYVYRDGGTTPYATVDAAALTFADTVGWSTTHSYMIRAYNAAGRRSPRTATVSATTGVATKSDLVVTNTNTSSSISVWVQSTTTGLWWTGGLNPSGSSSTKPGGLSIAKKNKTGTFYQLPYDTYTVMTSTQSKSLNPATTPSTSFSN